MNELYSDKLFTDVTELHSDKLSTDVTELYSDKLSTDVTWLHPDTPLHRCHWQFLTMERERKALQQAPLETAVWRRSEEKSLH